MSYSPNPKPRLLALLPIAISALCAVFAAQMAWHDPRYLFPFFGIAAMASLPAILARWRMRRLLISGDVKRVLGTWQSSIERVMYPETMAPLMAATAYAAYGWLEPAREALGKAVRGPAWEAALEQRLFVETLLDTFEGDRSTAISKAEVLQHMPVPPAGFFARKRIALLRQGIAAFARAYAHRSKDSDADLLARAARASPLVYWAMRYAAAIVAIDHGKSNAARRFLEGAPEWPKESAFRVYHEELLAHASS